jgi:hypothetical protein
MRVNLSEAKQKNTCYSGFSSQKAYTKPAPKHKHIRRHNPKTLQCSIKTHVSIICPHFSGSSSELGYSRSHLYTAVHLYIHTYLKEIAEKEMAAKSWFSRRQAKTLLKICRNTNRCLSYHRNQDSQYKYYYHHRMLGCLGEQQDGSLCNHSNGLENRIKN